MFDSLTDHSFFDRVDHGLVTIPESLIDDFGKEIQASYRMQEEFIPCNRLLNDRDTLILRWNKYMREAK